MLHLIERLRPSHAATYRALMLEAYARHPDAFTSTASERSALPMSWWEGRLNESADAPEVVLAVTQQQAIVGVVGLAFSMRQKARHKVQLFGMYVAPHHQQKGLGRALVDGALAWAGARPGALVIQLTVSEPNHAARRLYEQSGFSAFGIEPMAVATEEGFISKVHMWRPLS